MDTITQTANDTGAGAGAGATFFEAERTKLIADISKGIESILGASNDVNRALEESISVGKEFHPIAELWSKFERIMHAAGIPNLHNPIETTEGAQGGEGAKSEEAQGEKEEVRFETEPAVKLPKGVAPGGGRIYA